MIKLLISKMIKNHEEVNEPAVRSAYGKLAGGLGIVCNFVLFVIKFIAGLISGSVAVLSDAFNNLSDMGSSVVSLIGTIAASQHADEEHPFGHGRFEYIASLIVSFIIMMVGFELLRSSFDKVLQGQQVAFSWMTICVLVFSMLVKLWMFASNRYIGKTIQSMVIRATAQDSLNDVFATGGVVLATFLGLVLPWSVDGIMGMLISVLIMLAGFGIARDTITVLLGTPPDPVLVEQIYGMLLRHEGIEGVHDLIIHDYGPGRRMASVHAEVPVDGDIVKIHEVIDATEKEIQKELGVHIVIHMDPISVGNEKVEALKKMALRCVHEVNPVFGLHDFRITDGEQNINLIFDLEVPYSVKPSEREKAVAAIKEKIKEQDCRFSVVIQVDDKI